MYGYVRPVKSELRIGEYEQFRAVYCGLCEALKKRCGFMARFVVNYDLTFLAMVLSDYDGCFRRKRCPAHPLRRRYCLCSAASLDVAADYSVILGWWKLRDNISDKSFWKGIPYRVAAVLLKGAYRKAAAARPAFDRTAEQCLQELAQLEAQCSPSLDETADCFAKILVAAADECPEGKKRILRELFYHMGRYVYILDAIDDYADDWQSGSYNPIQYRFSTCGGELGDEERKALQTTLNLSQRCIATAFQLMDKNPWTPIAENIIYLGLPLAAEKVLCGQWNKREKRKEIIPVLNRGEQV